MNDDNIQMCLKKQTIEFGKHLTIYACKSQTLTVGNNDIKCIFEEFRVTAFSKKMEISYLVVNIIMSPPFRVGRHCFSPGICLSVCFNIYEHDRFMLGWVERGKGFYHLGSCLGQQQYSFPKIKLIIGHPKTSLKQIIMFLPDLQKKERV